MPTADDRARARELVAKWRATNDASLSDEDRRFLIEFNVACRVRRESIQSWVNLVLFAGLAVALYAALR